MALTFVAGHVFGSIAAPIALAESWAPDRRTEPWLRIRGLVVMALLWVAGSAFILVDQLNTDPFHISWGQGVGTVLTVLALILVALRLPRSRSRLAGQAPSPLLVLVTSASLLVVRSVVPTGWIGTIAAAASIVAWLVIMGRWSRRTDWTGAHLVAAVTGNLLSIGLPAFWTDPLGDVPLTAKLTTNAVLLGLVLATAYVGLRRERSGPRAQAPAQPG